MLKWLKRIGVTLGLVHVLTYVFLSDWMLERRACDKFLEFTERRFANPYNKNVSESIIISSCGDEFFRDPSRIVAAAKASNPDHKPEEIDHWDEAFENDFNQSIFFTNYPQDFYGTIQAKTDTLESRNCIIYEVCSRFSIPMMYKRIQFKYAFSAQPTDFHVMYYNGQNLISTSQYVWLLFSWVELTGEVKNSWGDEK
jgi:hypothetical protein